MKELFTRALFGLVFLLFVFGPYFLDLQNATSLLTFTLFLFSFLGVYEVFVMSENLKGNSDIKLISLLKKGPLLPALILCIFLYLPVLINALNGIYHFNKNVAIWEFYLSHKVITVFAFLLAFSIIIFSVLVFSKKDISKLVKSPFVLSFLYATLPFLLLSIVYCQSDFDLRALLLAILLCIYMNDSFAYLTGKFLGKHKMFPSVSPKKTWEGFLGGIVLAALGLCLILFFRSPGSDPTIYLFAIILSVCTSILATLGDLWESRLKRTAGVKDSGKILPGHGGILDRVDAMLFASTLLYVLLYLL